MNLSQSAWLFEISGEALENPQIADLVNKAETSALLFRDFWDSLPEEQSDIVLDYMRHLHNIYSELLIFTYNKGKNE
jgi:hypothetical protein